MSELGLLELLFGHREELADQRVRRTTAQFADRYQRLLDDLEAQGLDEFIPQEMARARHELAQIRSLLDSDPFAARERSMQLGQWIGGLPSYARRVRKEFEHEALQRERERLRRLQQDAAEAKARVLKMLDEEFAAFSDPIVRDLAYDQLRQLSQEVSSLQLQPGQEQETIRRIGRQLAHIRQQAEQAAEKWRQEHAAETKQEAQRAFVQLCQEQVESEPAVVGTEILEKLRSLKQSLQQPGAGEDADQLAEQAAQLLQEADKQAVDEQCRREAVRGVIEALGKLGFVVDPPRRVREQGEDVVLIHARKPAGQRALVEITARGSMKYQFDQYEGMACKQDIDQVFQLLEQIYGIHLSDHRVLWQNPQRIQKGARDPGLGGTQQSYGRS